VVDCFGGDSARAAEYMDMGLFLGSRCRKKGERNGYRIKSTYKEKA